MPKFGSSRSAIDISHEESATVKSKVVIKKLREFEEEELQKFQAKMKSRVESTSAIDESSPSTKYSQIKSRRLAHSPKRQRQDTQTYGENNFYSLLFDEEEEEEEEEVLDVDSVKSDDDSPASVIIRVFKQTAGNRCSLRFLRRLIDLEIDLLEEVRFKLTEQGRNQKYILHLLAEEILPDGTRKVEGWMKYIKDNFFVYETDVIDEKELSMDNETDVIDVYDSASQNDKTVAVALTSTLTSTFTDVIDDNIRMIPLTMLDAEVIASDKEFIQDKEASSSTQNVWKKQQNLENKDEVDFPWDTVQSTAVSSRVSTTYGEGGKAKQIASKIWSDDPPQQMSRKRGRVQPTSASLFTVAPPQAPAPHRVPAPPRAPPPPRAPAPPLTLLPNRVPVPPLTLLPNRVPDPPLPLLPAPPSSLPRPKSLNKSVHSLGSSDRKKKVAFAQEIEGNVDHLLITSNSQGEKSAGNSAKKKALPDDFWE
jgi:hypothetical protein